MTEQHPLTDEICHAIEKDLNLEWAMDCDEYMCMRAGADWQMKQVIEFLKNDLDKSRLLFKFIDDICTPEIDVESVINDLKKAMRPTATQEDKSMTDQQQHPITPPSELLQRLRKEAPVYRDCGVGREKWLIERAAQWGYDQRGEVNESKLQQARDQELEACCEWTTANFGELPGQNLNLFRRPKPPSLKEQALEAHVLS